MTIRKIHPHMSRKEAVRAFQAIAVELATLQERIGKLDELVKIQCTDGNWDFDPYMHGMANALLLAQTVLKDSDYAPLLAPEKWRRENHEKAD